MFPLFLILIITVTNQLTCPQLYDYSGSAVGCATVCPSNTNLHNNSICCGINQFYANNSCVLCTGWVTNNNTACCHYGQYYSQFDAACKKCAVETFLNGRLCCTGCYYLDMTLATPKCVANGQGTCSFLLCTSKQRICCLSGQYFYLPNLTCLSKDTTMNCDEQRKVCCFSGGMLDYINGELTCTTACTYSKIDSVQCGSQYCSVNNVSVLTILKTQGILLSFSSGLCCYALDQNRNCLQYNSSCTTRFASDSLSVCCSKGQFYDLKNSVCKINCTGIVSVGIFCIPNNTFIDFSQSPPQIIQAGSPCLSRILPPLMTLCCPFNKYANGSYGCQVCNGRIFGITDHQKCCSNDQTYDIKNNACQKCTGVIDVSGTICCPYGTVVNYNADGTVSCTDNCSLDNLQNARSCCSACTTCSANTVTCGVPKVCNPAYFVTNSCQACSCGGCFTTNSLCTQCNPNSQDLNNCIYPCPSGTVFENNTRLCLNCDASCQTCIAANSKSSCLICSPGYALNNGNCEPCIFGCRTCSTVSVCTSCYSNSLYSVLMNGTCVRDCNIGYFLDSSLTCYPCDSSCLTCNTNSSTSCLSCFSGFYLQNNLCNSCAAPCRDCLSSSICRSCNIGYSYFNSTCITSCPINFTSISYFTGSICIACAPICNGCSQLPYNCQACNNGFYLNSSFGINNCVSCPVGCLSCSNSTNCQNNCAAQYFSPDTLACLKCDSSCLSCQGPTNYNCTGCIVGVNLVSGMCTGCDPTCLTCTIPMICTSCSTGLLLYNSKCLQQCPTGTFLNTLNNTCSTCSMTCSTCNDNITCTSCDSSYPYFDDQVCTNKCNSSSYISGSSCQLCNGTVYLIGTACCPPDKKVIDQRLCIIVTDPTTNPHPIINPNNNTDQTNQTNSTQPSAVVYNNPNSLSQYITIQQNNAFIYLCGNADLNYSLLTITLIALNTSRLLQNANITLNTTLISVSDSQMTVKAVIPTTSNPIIVTTYNNTVLYSPALLASLKQQSYQNNSISNMKYIGYIYCSLTLLFVILSKYKSHFQAEETNRFILHVFNFYQIVYLFMFHTQPTNQQFGLFMGFGFSHFSFMPNLFGSLIPADYLEGNQPNTFVPDANILRNSGSLISIQLLIIGLFFISNIISLVVFKIKQLLQPPFIRKIFRQAITLFSLAFMSESFFSVSTLLYKSANPKYPSLSNNCYIASICIVVLTSIAIISFFWHYYLTYLSDQEQHLYTLRQTSQMLQSMLQGIVLALSVNSYLVYFLVALEIAWFLFNATLYKNTETVWRTKLYVSEGCILVGYVFLGMMSVINLAGVLILIAVATTLFVYCIYQIVGLYYWDVLKLFGIDQPEDAQIQSPVDKNDKQTNFDVPNTQFE